MSTKLNIEKNLSYLKEVKAIDETSVPESEKKLRVLQSAWYDLLSKGYRSSLVIKTIEPKGLGVFADRDYSKGEILEYCHCVLSAWKSNYIHEPSYKQYAYWEHCECKECKTHGQRGVFVLGTGSIVNSVETVNEQNVHMELYGRIRLGVIRAVRDIEKDQELLTYHGENYFNSWCKPNIEAFNASIAAKNNSKPKLNSIVA
jgi:hypothetical protein